MIEPYFANSFELSVNLLRWNSSNYIGRKATYHFLKVDKISHYYDIFISTIDMYTRKHVENLDPNVNILPYMLFNKAVVKLEADNKRGYVRIVCI